MIRQGTHKQALACLVNSCRRHPIPPRLLQEKVQKLEGSKKRQEKNDELDGDDEKVH